MQYLFSNLSQEVNENSRTTTAVGSMYDSWDNDEPMDKRLVHTLGGAGNCHHCNLHDRTLPSPTDCRDYRGDTAPWHDTGQQATTTARCGMVRGETTGGVDCHERGQGQRENSCFRCPDSRWSPQATL